MSSFQRSSPTHSREIFKEQSSSYICSQFCDNQHWCVGGGGRKGWWGGEAGGAAAYYESFLPNWTFLLHILSQTVGVAGSGKKVVLEKKTELKRACLNTIPITS